jgi:hypothetical protein
MLIRDSRLYPVRWARHASHTTASSHMNASSRRCLDFVIPTIATEKCWMVHSPAVDKYEKGSAIREVLEIDIWPKSALLGSLLLFELECIELFVTPIAGTFRSMLIRYMKPDV